MGNQNDNKQLPFFEAISHIQSIIENTEYEGKVYAVGGLVRDFLIGRKLSDIDLVVSLPDGGIRFAKWMESVGETEGKVVIYPTFGVGMFRLKKYPEIEIECVMTRGEQYHDDSSRKPETVYGSIMEDCVRRDFTINALYLNVSTNDIKDFTGKGIDDLKNCIIRVTNTNPDIVLSEDPLRILRAVRFSCQLGFGIEEHTFEAMKRNAKRLCIVSKERIASELDKILLSGNPVIGLRKLMECGAIYYIVCEAMQFEREVWEHTLKVVENASESNDRDVMLSALLHNIGNPYGTSADVDAECVEKVRSRLMDLKYDRKTVSNVSFIVANHTVWKSIGDATPNDISLRKFQKMCGDRTMFDKCLALIDADNKACKANSAQVTNAIARTDEMVSEGEHMFGFRLPVNGNDVMEAAGCKSGKEVGECLSYLTSLCTLGVRRMDKEACIQAVKEYIKRKNG